MNSATVPSPATGRERNDAFAARFFPARPPDPLRHLVPPPLR
jgi:hypothetical protein